MLGDGLLLAALVGGWGQLKVTLAGLLPHHPRHSLGRRSHQGLPVLTSTLEREREGGREGETERVGEEQLNDPYFFERRPFTTKTTNDW